MTKILIAYHDNCIDGFTSAYVTHQAVTKLHKDGECEVALLPVTYNRLGSFYEKLTEKFDALFVVDFSLAPVILERVGQAYPKMVTTIIDHHKSAREMYGNLEFCRGARIVMDMNESGATLAWKYFYPDAGMPRLLEYVRDYDLWLFELRNTKAVNKYLQIQEKTIEDWEWLELSFASLNSLRAPITQGNAIQKYHDIIVESLILGSEEIELAGEVGLCVNCSPEFASAVGDILASKCGTFGATWQQLGKDTVFSLRSIGDYDVSELAVKFGGGGHRNAAGFRLSTPQEGEVFPDSDAPNIGVKVWSIKQQAED